MDDRLPFTPPPHYLPSRDLPRKRKQQQQAQQQASEPDDYEENSLARSISVMRSSSNRTPQSDGRIAKSNRIKKRRPGLSIDTSVTRHPARPPQQINFPQVQPWQSTQPTIPPTTGDSVNSFGANNSPSRFPATYLNTSNRETMRPSPGHQDLYFAPPPGSRRSSSVYSQATRASSTKESLSRGRSLRNKLRPSSSRRTSTIAGYEDDVARRSRYISGGTVFEEDGISARVPDTAYTITPHRSRGWWNVITTPFENKPGMALEYRSPLEGAPTPAVPSIPAQFVNPLSSPHRQAIARNKSTASSATDIFSPEDREVPIMLDASSPERTRNSPRSAAASTLNRMPFADVGKSPPSGLEEFSPAGMVAGRGHVGGAATFVNVSIPQTHRGQTVEVLSVPLADQTRPKRASFKETVSRTVRFISPRSSAKSGPQAQIVVSQEPQSPAVPPTPKSVRFAGSPFNQQFSPPPHASTQHSVDIWEEFEFDDKPIEDQNKKRGFSSLFGHKNHKKEDKKKPKDKKEKKKMSKRRKCCLCCLCILITGLVMLAAIIVLAVMMSRKHNGSSTAVTWTNITNFPAIPNGPLTVARPNLVAQQNACVVPLTVWSCSVPKEQQAAIQPNDADEPNFVIDVFYDNTTNVPITTKRSASGAATAGHFGGLMRRSQFTPSPGPPAEEEYAFLGNTTDNITAPFQGEDTPFYISLLMPGSTTTNNPTKVKRDPQSASSQSANSIPNLADLIPTPSLNPDGTPPPANLLPFPSYQPVRLFNRGLSTEHYGFYTYFDRNIFLRSNTVASSTEIIPADENGGSAQVGANVRCTWQQTRFLVQIWTRMAGNATLLSKASSGSKVANGDFSRPGSFPYPVTFTIDRHGGGPTSKMLYCFGMTVDGKVNVTERKFQLETRSFNGSIVNPSGGPFSNDTKVTIEEGGPGGMDGGTGGCYCKWQNWS